jgi:hypothetical protein
MSVIGRCFDGERTGDMHANCWEDFQIEDGAFPSGWAPREKTGLPQRLEIPPFGPSCERTGLRRASRSPGHYSRCSGAIARGVSGTEATTLEPSGSIYNGRSGSKSGALCRVRWQALASRGWRGASSGR